MTEMLNWAESMGKQWVANADAMDRQLKPAGDAGLEALAPRPGESILDLGCGSGATTAQLCLAVAPNGRVTGADVSPDQIAAARARPENAGADFIVGDAQTHGFEAGTYDGLFSRFGCMFFNDPPAAFANLRRAMKPGGRAALVVWSDPKRNPWASLPAQACNEVLGPAETFTPGAPGPFAWYEPGIFRPILEGGGFSGLDWREQPVTLQMGHAGPETPVQRAVQLAMEIGIIPRRLRGAPPEAAEPVARRLAELLAPHVSDGWVRLPGVIWVIRATA